MIATSAEVFYDALYHFGTAFLLFKISKLLYRTLLLLTTYFVFGDSFHFRSYGSWAVVTGATDGIGRQYAEQLAAKGLNIVLISRTPSKLAEVAAFIAGKYKVETKVIQADFTRGPELYSLIEQQLINIDVGILVNNVGMIAPPGDFLDVPDRERLYPLMLNCNALATLSMTSILLPKMVSKEKGAIINVSSFLGEGHQTYPASVYSSTKSFVSSLSRSLHIEYVSRGIVIQTLTTGIVSSSMSSPVQNRSQLGAPSAATYVRSALGTLGTADDTCGYFWHQIMLEIANALPEPVLRFITAWSRSLMKAVN